MPLQNKYNGRIEKPDRITNPDSIASSVDEAIYYALQPLDAIVVDMENKWGVERLPRLVSPKSAAKFGAAKAKLDAAIDNRNPDAVARRAAVLIRGWQALDYEAVAREAPPASKKLRIMRGDSGRAFGIAVDAATAAAAVKSGDYPETSIWSLDEVVRVLEAHEITLSNKVKQVWPGAKVVDVRVKPIDWAVGDELPWDLRADSECKP